MEPCRKDTDALYQERVARAQRMPPDLKLLEGPRLFDRARRIMMDGIRNEFPDADEPTVRRVLRERLALARRLENGVGDSESLPG